MSTVGFNTVLVRYGEIAVKSKKVRVRMENTLLHNIREQLMLNGVEKFRIRREWGRIFISDIDNMDSCIKALSRTFGVTSISPCMPVSLDLDEIKKAVVGLAKEALKPGDTFAVRVHRAYKEYPMTSKELEKLLGAEILDKIPGVKVDLEKPSKTIYVEVRTDAAYVFDKEYEGPGGLPYGVEGRVIALASGGADSTIAAWMMMKRGCEVIPVHYNLSPFYGDDARERVYNALAWLRTWVPRRKWYVYEIPLGRIHEKINIDTRYRCLLCKFLMYKIAEEIAKREGAKAIVTGESLGQVASQTLDNLYFLSTKISIPVLRPLIGYDKNEIISFARKLGIEPIVARKVLACMLSPKMQSRKAETHASDKVHDIILDAINNSEFKSPESVIKYALDNSVKHYL